MIQPNRTSDPLEILSNAAFLLLIICSGLLIIPTIVEGSISGASQTLCEHSKAWCAQPQPSEPTPTALERRNQDCALGCILGFHLSLIVILVMLSITYYGRHSLDIHEVHLLKGTTMSVCTATGAMLGRSFDDYYFSDMIMSMEEDIEAGYIAWPMKLDIIDVKGMRM